MLNNCPECNLQVSDKAISCPHCGYPLKLPDEPPTVRKKVNRRRKLPNGFGQITEIKNRNLQKPFRAMVTIGKDKVGKPICKPLKPNAYFKTYNEAYSALMEYNKDPYYFNQDITMNELFLQWIDYKYRGIDKNKIRWITSSWKYCSSVYDLKAAEIRPRHIKFCIDNGVVIDKSGNTKHSSPHIKRLIKVIFGMIFDYALEYELVSHNYAKDFKLDNKFKKEIEDNLKEHISFTDEEINTLWANLYSVDYVDMILIQCYSGWRPKELIELEIQKIDLENGFFKGGMKTKAGINRLVPIHPKIRALVEQRYNEAIKINSDRLFNIEKSGNYKAFTYDHLRKIFSNICSSLNLNPEHRPHDCRKHFITMAKKYNVDEYAIKYIVGHTITDITEKVYTDRTAEWLKTEIEKIK